MQKRIVIIVDYRGAFYSTVGTQRTLCSMSVKKISDNFSNFGFDVDVVQFADVDLYADWLGVPVIYTSSEDIGLLYKGFIEDVLLSLEASGALLLPSYRYLRAHHNKLMMELLRCQLFPAEATRLNTRCFGTYEELHSANLSSKWPKVLKAAYGAGAKQVVMAKNRIELLSLARKLSRSWTVGDLLREFRSRILWRGYVPRSINRNKFIVQDLIKNLDGDFKVLRYGNRFYLLSRRNRKNDFRASGSGNFSVDIPSFVDVNKLLDYSKIVSDTIGTPLCSLDVAFDGHDFHLIEFQCVNFGTLTAEASPHFYKKTDNSWQKLSEQCDLEAIFCEAIVNSIDSCVAGA